VKEMVKGLAPRCQVRLARSRAPKSSSCPRPRWQLLPAVHAVQYVWRLYVTPYSTVLSTPIYVSKVPERHHLPGLGYAVRS